MKKLSVGELFEQQQAMMSSQPTLSHHPQQNKNMQQLQHLFEQLQMTIQQAQQSIRQINQLIPEQTEMQVANKRLNYAIQLISEIHSSFNEEILGFTASKQVQFKQLEDALLQAGDTLQLIQKNT